MASTDQSSRGEIHGGNSDNNGQTPASFANSSSAPLSHPPPPPILPKTWNTANNPNLIPHFTSSSSSSSVLFYRSQPSLLQKTVIQFSGKHDQQPLDLRIKPSSQSVQTSAEPSQSAASLSDAAEVQKRTSNSPAASQGDNFSPASQLPFKKRKFNLADFGAAIANNNAQSTVTLQQPSNQSLQISQSQLQTNINQSNKDSNNFEQELLSLLNTPNILDNLTVTKLSSGTLRELELGAAISNSSADKTAESDQPKVAQTPLQTSRSFQQQLANVNYDFSYERFHREMTTGPLDGQQSSQSPKSNPIVSNPIEPELKTGPETATTSSSSTSGQPYALLDVFESRQHLYTPFWESQQLQRRQQQQLSKSQFMAPSSGNSETLISELVSSNNSSDSSSSSAGSNTAAPAASLSSISPLTVQSSSTSSSLPIASTSNYQLTASAVPPVSTASACSILLTMPPPVGQPPVKARKTAAKSVQTQAKARKTAVNQQKPRSPVPKNRLKNRLKKNPSQNQKSPNL